MNSYEKYHEFSTLDSHCWSFGEDVLSLPRERTGREFEKEVTICGLEKRVMKFEEVRVRYLFENRIPIQETFLMTEYNHCTYLIFDNNEAKKIEEKIRMMRASLK